MSCLSCSCVVAEDKGREHKSRETWSNSDDMVEVEVEEVLRSLGWTGDSGGTEKLAGKNSASSDISASGGRT